MRYILSTLLCTLFFQVSIAKNNNEISLSGGILSNYQFRGIFNGPLVGYMDMPRIPQGYSGAAFITYRRLFFNKLAVRATAGLDNQSGRLSYGPPHSSTFSSVYSSGYYKRRSYTIAAECFLCYRYRKEYDFL